MEVFQAVDAVLEAKIVGRTTDGNVAPTGTTMPPARPRAIPVAEVARCAIGRMSFPAG